VRRSFAAACVAAALAVAPAARPAAAQEVSRDRIERTIAVVRPALVQLTVVSQQFAEGRAVRYPSGGSGVIVSAAGHVLTNYHVAGKSVRIRATLASGEEVPATVVAHDPLTDLSVLRLEASRSFAPLEFAAADPQVGTPVLALGNPLSLASTVTLGIVSNARRVFTDFTSSRLQDLDLDGEPTGLYTLWLQHDALILPGNSGGPLVDLEGRIVGINELGGAGIGFAIPASMARSVLASVLAEGRVRRADLGFTVLPVTKAGREDGALVAAVHAGTAGERAGLLPGDFLLALDGKAVAVRFFEQVPELYQRIAELAIGAPVELEIDRDGERRRLQATPTELDESLGREAESRALGIAVQELSVSMARARQLPPRSGLVVTSLRAGRAAAQARPPLQAGDLLTHVAGRAVTSLAELDTALAGTAAGDVLLGVRRDDERLLSVARVADERSVRSGGELPKAWLGLATQVMTPALAQGLGSAELRGFRVTQVLPWSEAERAGFAVGDVLGAIDGRALVGEREQDVENLRRAVEEREIGDVVAFAVDRGGQPMTVAVVLEARPKSAGEVRTARQEVLGFAVRDVTPFDRIDWHWPRDQQGVLITEIVPGGWAQMGGLEPSDLVLSIDGRSVADVAAFERVMSDLARDRPSVVRLFLRRASRTHFVFLEPSWNGERGATEGSR
jgi:serine protease Do